MARFATGAIATLLLLGGACGPSQLFVGTTTGSPLDVPETWQEHWFEHDQLLQLFAKREHVAVYVDADVDQTKAGPLVPYASSLWDYTLETYGSMGPGDLYVILHQGRYLGCHMDNHFSTQHDGRDVIDCGFQSYDDLTVPIFLMGHVAANIVESTSNGRDGSPAMPLWHDSKWAELYQWDSERAIGRTQEADLHYGVWTGDGWVDDFPVAGTHWFRDWFHPLWADHGGAAVMARFFATLAARFPANGARYARAMNWGEYIHFMSGAAGTDLRPLATKAFGWPAEWDALHAQARIDFPQITY
jgi:hypothetical protein